MLDEEITLYLKLAANPSCLEKPSPFKASAERDFVGKRIITLAYHINQESTGARKRAMRGLSKLLKGGIK
jgi:hypothetical protein